ncbi:UNVERIFIED_CONTAM: hypothetical protein GTU68_037550 [Idotea baltica]|nr:hypothetical protein [Idotea baltica]
MDEIHFHSEDIPFELANPTKVADWISAVVVEHGYSIAEVSYIFCNDDYLLQVNQEHLDHDYFTDIITFPLHEAGSTALISDMFISIDRVKDNASSIKAPFLDELHRVMIHGILHQIGFDDKTEELKSQMRVAEDAALMNRNWL